LGGPVSVRVMSLVWDSDVPAAQRLTLLALADRADEDGYCWPSVATLMEKCRSGESTIRRHLKELEEMGVLRVERRPNKVSKYFIQLDRLREPSRSETSRSETSRSETTPSRSETTPLSNRDLQRSQIETRYISDPSVDPSVIHQRSTSAEPPREDVEALCTRLRERMIGNGFKPPAITADWRNQARLLLDRDERDLTQALRLLDWATADEFWHPNIKSMGKFRAQYDTLLARARQDQQRRRAAAGEDRITGWQALKDTGTEPALRALPPITREAHNR
jgi:DNA-binding transcriptional ArsR family regulator